MPRKKTQIATFSYPEKVDLEEANSFIKKYEKLSVYIGLKHGFERRICNCRETFISGALEGCYKSFLILTEKFSKPWDEKLIRVVIRSQVKRRIYSMAIIEGYLPSSGQVFFPKKWINWDEYFGNVGSTSGTRSELEVSLILETLMGLKDKNEDILLLFMAGYDFSEISQKLKYKGRSSSRVAFDRMIVRARKKLNII